MYSSSSTDNKLIYVRESFWYRFNKFFERCARPNTGKMCADAKHFWRALVN